MADDILRRLFGAGAGFEIAATSAALIMLVMFVGGFLIWAWPKLTMLVTSINLIAGLAKRLDTMDERLERVRAQVENSHSTNLREELDSDRADARARHAESVSLIRGVQKDVGRLDQRDIDRGRQLDALDSKLDKHLEWSAEWSRNQENTDRDLAEQIADTLNVKKENPHG